MVGLVRLAGDDRAAHPRDADRPQPQLLAARAARSALSGSSSAAGYTRSARSKSALPPDPPGDRHLAGEGEELQHLGDVALVRPARRPPARRRRCRAGRGTGTPHARAGRRAGRGGSRRWPPASRGAGRGPASRPGTRARSASCDIGRMKASSSNSSRALRPLRPAGRTRSRCPAGSTPPGRRSGRWQRSGRAAAGSGRSTRPTSSCWPIGVEQLGPDGDPARLVEGELDRHADTLRRWSESGTSSTQSGPIGTPNSVQPASGGRQATSA